MKKFFKSFMIALVFMCTIFTTVACKKETTSNDTAPPTTTNATAFEVMTKATEQLDATTTSLNSASIQEESNNPTPTASKFKIQPVTTTYAGEFRKATIQEYMARQQFVSYVFHNVNYALQSCKEENGYTTNFELGKTFYGPATNTPNNDLNYILEQYNLSTTLAVTVSQEIDGISFVVDWDMRNNILEQYSPFNNTVYMVNGYVKYNYKSNKVNQIIINTFQTEKSGQFWVSKIDYVLNTFVYIEGYRTEVWEDFNSQDQKTDLATLFNNGQLSYNKICEYPYKGLFVGTGNISNNVNNVNFEGYWKFCNDINNPEGTYAENSVTETQFATLFNFAYGYNLINNKIYDLKMRNDSDKQDLTNAFQVDFMNDAVTYGTNKTTCIFIVNSQDQNKYDACIMFFIEYEDFKTYLNDIIEILETKANASESAKDLANDSLAYLNSINKDKYLGELDSFNSQNLKLEFVTPDSNSIRWNTCTTSSFNYRILNDEVQIDFTITNGEVEITAYPTV